MQFRISFEEIAKMMAQKTGQNVPMSYADTHTIRISYSKLFMNMNLDITIERVLGCDVRVSYKGSIGVDTMVKMAINQIKNRPEGAMIEDLDNNLLVLHLNQNPQLAQLLEHAILQDVCFDPEFVIIDFVPKDIM